jgi:homoserine O-acetyltransferase
VNSYILDFLREVLPDIMHKDGDGESVESSVGALTKSSTFGEAEVEVRPYLVEFC